MYRFGRQSSPPGARAGHLPGGPGIAALLAVLTAAALAPAQKAPADRAEAAQAAQALDQKVIAGAKKDSEIMSLR